LLPNCMSRSMPDAMVGATPIAAEYSPVAISTPLFALGIFPGRLEMDFPGHSLIIENTHPMFAFEFTRVNYNGTDVTRNIVDLLVNIDADNNIVQANITLYKAHWLSADEVATYNII
jgi:hypothetical protein